MHSDKASEKLNIKKFHVGGGSATMMKLIVVIVNALIPSLVFVPCALWMRCLPQIKIMIIDLERETVRTQYVKKIYQHA